MRWIAMARVWSPARPGMYRSIAAAGSSGRARNIVAWYGQGGELMYLSRVRVDLNGLSRGALFDIMDGKAYAAHQLLWRLFPEYQGARPFLFRQEMEGAEEGGAPRGLPLFYVLSDREPVSIPGLLEVQCKPFSPVLEVGERLAFRLRANPTVAKSVAGKRGRRADVLMAAKYPSKPVETGRARLVPRRWTRPHAVGWKHAPSPGGSVCRPSRRWAPIASMPCRRTRDVPFAFPASTMKPS